VTLDSHHRTHIAHAICWKNKDGQRPQPFTIITHDEIAAGVWSPVDASLRDHCLYYTKSLEAQGKFKLCIWPEHCLLGTPGHNVHPVLNEALMGWIESTGKQVHYVMKGENCMTEMYSAIKAEVEMSGDSRTKTNPLLQAELQNSEKLLVCGQALSHCVNSTFTDILKTYPIDSRMNMVLLTDASSSVPGFEANGTEFVNRIKAAGCTLSTTTTFFNAAERNQV